MNVPHCAAVVAAHAALGLPVIGDLVRTVNDEVTDGTLTVVVLSITVLCSVVLVVATSWLPRVGLAVLGSVGLCGLLGIAHGMATVATLTTLAGFSLLHSFLMTALAGFYGFFAAMPAGFVLGLVTSLPIGLAASARLGEHPYAPGWSLLASGSFALGLAVLARSVPLESSHFGSWIPTTCHVAMAVGALVVARGGWLLARA